MSTRQNATPYDVHDVASAIIREALVRGTPVSNLQLQKLLYLSQIAYVHEHSRLLFSEPIVAWQYGPVVKVSYYEYAYRGASSLRRPHKTKDTIDGTSKPVRDLDDATMSVIRPIIQKWCERPLWDIVGETHRKGGPWDITYNPAGRPAGAGYGDVIDPWLYAQFYDPKTCSVMLGTRRDDLADGNDSTDATDSTAEDSTAELPSNNRTRATDISESEPDGETDCVTDFNVSLRVPSHLVGILYARARANGKTEQEYLESVVSAFLECL